MSNQMRQSLSYLRTPSVPKPQTTDSYERNRQTKAGKVNLMVPKLRR